MSSDTTRSEHHAAEGKYQKKLTPGDVREIRRRYDQEDITYYELAEDYPIHPQSLGPIIRRECWKYVDGPEGGA